FERYASDELQAQWVGEHGWHAFGKTLQVRAFPIGIDVDEFQALAQARAARDTCEQLRRECAAARRPVGRGRRDYPSGRAQRLKACRTLLQNYPENQGSATLIQIASPSRESVDAYAALRAELESLSGAINGEHGELDWMPLRYIHRNVARKRLPGLYRAASV